MATANTQKVVRQADHDRGMPTVDSWQPRWQVDCGDDCRVGITVDDGCFVVLYPQRGGGWKPGKHIPRQAAEKISQLLTAGELN